MQSLQHARRHKAPAFLRTEGYVEMTERTQAILEITERYLDTPTAKQKLLARLFRSEDNRYQPFCEHLTREDCVNAASTSAAAGRCDKLHFEPILYPHTDPKLGHCSYLNTCHRLSTCKYMHFKIAQDDPTPDFRWRAPYAAGSQEMIDAPLLRPSAALRAHDLAAEWAKPASAQTGDTVYPPQWINCDLKTFDVGLLGKWDVIVADPPWDIHMALPYGTMTDDDMRAMPVPSLQDEGLIFLWVTGRAMELGRELLKLWGYARVDELIWVKVGQTQRLIRTGRTGHWLNHTKEHCLVGAKVKRGADDSSDPVATANAPGGAIGAVLPDWVHRGLSTDVIVSEVRDTSRKPDELYAMIEKMCPGGRKIELFGRRQNCRPGWLTLGNQLKSDNLVDPALKERIESARMRGMEGLLPIAEPDPQRAMSAM